MSSLACLAMKMIVTEMCSRVLHSIISQQELRAHQIVRWEGLLHNTYFVNWMQSGRVQHSLPRKVIYEDCTRTVLIQCEQCRTGSNCAQLPTTTTDYNRSWFTFMVSQVTSSLMRG
ncbi:hypothetical protein Pelo_12322 [Pelomyxa schiedti]|nr:hypothetical protein Pelo_12322 [Pelomyxa schiedti]